MSQLYSMQDVLQSNVLNGSFKVVSEMGTSQPNRDYVESSGGLSVKNVSYTVRWEYNIDMKAVKWAIVLIHSLWELMFMANLACGYW